MTEMEDVKPNVESHDAPESENCKNCGNPCDPYAKPALTCSGGCSKKIHIECLKRKSVPVSFVGDVFFELNCSECNPFNEETVVRNRMPWLNVIVLTLYNLREKSSGISKRGYFHWKSDISTFVDRNWDHLFKKTVKRKKNWIGTISGTLSHYSGIFFKSGTNELGESGWWRLIDNDPPEVLIAKNGKMISERKRFGHLKSSNKLYNSPTPSESSVSVGEDSNYGGVSKFQVPSVRTKPCIPPTDTLSDFLLGGDELNDMNIEEGILQDDIHHNDIPSLAEIIEDCQYQNNNFHLPQLLDNLSSEWRCDTNTPSEPLNSVKNEDVKAAEPERFEEDSTDSLNSVQEQPPASLFKTTNRTKWPWQNSRPPVAKVPRMTPQEEVYLLQSVNKSDLNSASPAIRRLYRKLAVRKVKREHGLPLLDIDNLGPKTEISSKPVRDKNRVLDRFFGEDLECIFEQRLQGYNEPTSVHSPYTNRLLKPFIRRDTSCRPLWLRLMEELRAKVNKGNAKWKPPPRAPVDYSYVRPQHIPAINSLCSQFFWPGIDLTECLQYPDFSCVVLYKKLVIGFAILVPDVGYNEAYISFFLTRPEWRKSGIGTFMLYHLIQTCMGKDVTLHVSATNPALILYQKFGFKVEEFIQDFYDKYMSPNSRECRHALFLRLSR